MRRRVYEANRGSDLDAARHFREVFTDKPVEWEIDIPWQWPKRMQEIGTCEAVMYASDKWHKRGEFEDYKHIAEKPQVVLARPRFLVEYDSPSQELDVSGPMVDLGPMPSSFAVLANFLGLQARLYEPQGRDGYQLPNGKDAGYFEVNVARAKLGASRFPDTGEPFLLVYTNQGVDMIVLGEQLDVEKDGIVG